MSRTFDIHPHTKPLVVGARPGGRENIRPFAALLAVLGAVTIAYALVAAASSKEDIVFPVAELGNCKSERECKAYCDKPDNLLPCVAFAEQHNLMPREEAAKARKFAQVKRGPGGCTTKDSCEAYCNDITHIDECLIFAEANDLIPREELEEARKVQQALQRGVKLPGGCRNKDACDAYCEDSNHTEECITFAETAGFIPPDELEDARKALAAVKKGAKAPPCRGKRACDTYCGKPENMEACLTFAEAAGFIPPEELADAKRALAAIKKGAKPPPCRGQAECDAYCGEPDHLEECLAFAEAAGFMSAEDAAMARKTGGRGPGGCKGKETCEQFCKNPANEETCFQFGLEHGLIPPEDLQRMEEGKRQMQEMLKNVPPEVVTCLEGRLGTEYVEGLRQGTARPRDISADVDACLRSVPRLFQEGPEGSGMGPGGPGSESGMDPGGPGPEGMQLPPLDQFPPSVIACIKSAVGAETFEGIKSRTVPPPPEFGSVAERCVTEFRAQSFTPPPEGQTAPSPEGMSPPPGEVAPYPYPEGTAPPPPTEPQPSLNPFSPFFALLITIFGGR